MDNYKNEVTKRFGNTAEYKEFEQKTADYSKDKWQQVNDGLNAVFAEFAVCLQSGQSPDSSDAQTLVTKLKDYITENYYSCDTHILKGLGQMYVSDERFKNNIDKHGLDTAQFVSKAIETYCK